MEGHSNSDDGPVIVVVVGSPNSGKSSLVAAFSGRAYPGPSAAIEEVRIKTQQDGTRLHVVDTTDSGVERAVEQANVILLCFNACAGSAVEAEVSDWMDRIPSGVKVLLVGTHIDLRLRVAPTEPSEDELDALMDQMIDPASEERSMRLLKRHSNIVGSLEVSNTLRANVHLALTFAYAAVEHPREPLVEGDTLSKDFRGALVRMFFLLDTDGDGRLNESELCNYRRSVLQETVEENDVSIQQTIAQMKRWGEWSLGGMTFSGWERAFLDQIFERGSLWSVWTALKHFGYSKTLTLSSFPALRIAKRLDTDERLCFSKSGLSFIVNLFGRLKSPSGGVPLNNVRAMLALIPKEIIDDSPHWSNYDDLASGDIVAISGNGISLAAFVSLWMLLLERNKVANAAIAHRIGFILGYRDFEESPIVEIRKRADCDYHRLLIFGSGQTSRSRVIRGAVLGATKNVDEIMSAQRRIVSAGKFETVYLSSNAPSRLPSDLESYDVIIITFDAEENDRAFLRAGLAALVCRKIAPIVFAAVQKPTDEQLEWCRKRGIGQIIDATDSVTLRREILATLKEHDLRNRLTATPEDLKREALEEKRRGKQSGGMNSGRRNSLFLILVAFMILLALLVLPDALAMRVGIPASVSSLLVSIVGAALCVRIMGMMS